jgi:hypothetical protein
LAGARTEVQGEGGNAEGRIGGALRAEEKQSYALRAFG